MTHLKKVNIRGCVEVAWKHRDSHTWWLGGERQAAAAGQERGCTPLISRALLKCTSMVLEALVIFRFFRQPLKDVLVERAA